MVVSSTLQPQSSDIVTRSEQESQSAQSQAILDDFLSDLSYRILCDADTDIDFEEARRKLSENVALRNSLANLLKVSDQLREKVVQVVKDLEDGKEVDLTDVKVPHIPQNEVVKDDVDVEKDSSLIVDREMAERYVRQVLLANKEARSQLAKLKAKQKKHEKDLFAKRKAVLDRIEKDFRKEWQLKNKSSIMQKINSDNSAKLLDKKLQEAQHKFDSNALKFFEELYADYYRQFKRMKVPFFCLRKELYYNGYKEDRKFVVQLIDEILSN